MRTIIILLLFPLLSFGQISLESSGTSCNLEVYDNGFLRHSFLLSALRWEYSPIGGFVTKLKIWDDERQFVYNGVGATLEDKQNDIFARLSDIELWRYNCLN